MIDLGYRIASLTARDIRFPTSQNLDGSDAMNKDPDYSCVYVTLRAEHVTSPMKSLCGNGLTFTIGRGNEIVLAAVRALEGLVIGLILKDIALGMGEFWRHITGDSQLRWIGPEKGAVHMATGAIVNAVWDLWAKAEGKPLWKLICDLSPMEFIRCVDFTYLTDALGPKEALEILERNEATKQTRVQVLEAEGYPAYTTSAGWLGYSDEKLRSLCKAACDAGWNHVKMKVGADLHDDMRRLKIAREVIGPDRKLMVDANQRWDVPVAIDWMKALQGFDLWFIEEPTSPDDILGHLKIKQAIKPTRVASGEMCQNRVVFKQFIESGALDVIQIDSYRLGGVNEILAVYLLAAKFGLPVCPHAGGVGLCEYVQHLQMVDYVCISATMQDRVIEYVDHLHEHFLTPCILQKGHYMPPKEPGYSIDMHTTSLDTHEFPHGEVWKDVVASAGCTQSCC